MARKKSNPLTTFEPSPQQEADYTRERAGEKALLVHPQTQKLRKTLTAEMKKAAKGPQSPQKKQ